MEPIYKDISQALSISVCQPEVSNMWTVHIHPTTGGSFEVGILPDETVDGIKKVISRKLKISKDRINLLHKESVLKEGRLRDFGVTKDSKLTLLPNVESGLLSHKPEQHSVAQALENLTDAQVNDFLSGRAPLTLAMRLGDHMMIVQLQLSTSTSGTSRRTHSMLPNGVLPSYQHVRYENSLQQHLSNMNSNLERNSVSSNARHSTHRRDFEQKIPFSSKSYHRLPFFNNYSKSAGPYSNMNMFSDPNLHNYPSSSRQESNVPSGSETPQCASTVSHSNSLPHMNSLSHTSGTEEAVPISHKNSYPVHPTPVYPFSSSSSNNIPITEHSTNSDNRPFSSHQASSSAYGFYPESHFHSQPASRNNTFSPTMNIEPIPILDTSSLAEASKNISQKIKELSSAPSPCCVYYSRKKERSPSCSKRSHCSKSSRKSSSPVAVIESMHHHGSGVYSGTFSGTLNPALQDKDGKPKRSVGTIVHILNDLLGASSTPQIPTFCQQHQRDYLHHGYHHHGSKMHKSPGERQRLHQENKAMRGKVQKLQFMLEERRKKRKERRASKATPYSVTKNNVMKCDESSSINTSNSNSTSQMDVDTDVESSSINDNNMNDSYGKIPQEAVIAT